MPSDLPVTLMVAGSAGVAALVVIACVTLLKLGGESYDPPISEWNGNYRYLRERNRMTQLQWLCIALSAVIAGMFYVLMQLFSLLIAVCIAVAVVGAVFVAVALLAGATKAHELGGYVHD